MRILMLSWEYPPRSIGGLSNHVYYLAKALIKCDHEVHVVTCAEGDAPREEFDYGVHVHRVAPLAIDNEDFAKWTMHLNFALIAEAIRIINSSKKFDVIHAHDWLVAYTAKVLKEAYDIPVVVTIHATEYGRNNGIRTELQRYINATEKFLVKEASKVIVCSSFMKEHVGQILEVEENKLQIIPNGIEFGLELIGAKKKTIRKQYALEEEQIVFFIGRHVFEKGIQLLIEAIPEILKKKANTKFLIAGSGPMTEELLAKVKYMGLEDKVIFTGYMVEETKNNLYSIADVAIFPSLYEPFGIVALEAMANNCPVIVSDTGGFSEIIEHGKNGLKAIAGSTTSLAENIIKLLNDTELSMELSKAGLETVKQDYSWDRIADLTTKVYLKVEEEIKTKLFNN